MKRNLLFVVLLIGSFLALSSVASAAWYVATVNEAGIDPISGTTYVKLTYVSGPSPTWTGARWHLATGENAKAMLAVALSALSTGYTVTASLDDVTEWTTISGLFMRSE